MATSIQPTELKEKLASGAGVKLVDVRTPAEYQEVHVDGAVNVPLDRLEPGEHQPDSGPTAARSTSSAAAAAAARTPARSSRPPALPTW